MVWRLAISVPFTLFDNPVTAIGACVFGCITAFLVYVVWVGSIYWHIPHMPEVLRKVAGIGGPRLSLMNLGKYSRV